MSYVLQDTVLLLALATKDIRVDHVARLRQLTGPEHCVRSTWRALRKAPMAHVQEDISRWTVVQAVLVRLMPSSPFKKEMKADTWTDAEPVLKGHKFFSPTYGSLNARPRGACRWWSAMWSA